MTTASEQYEAARSRVLTAGNGAGAPEPEPTPEPQLTGVYDRLMALVPDMHQGLKRLEAHREVLIENHRLRLAQVDEERKKIASILRDLGQEPEKPVAKTTRTAGGRIGTRSVSASVLLKIIAAIEKHDEGSLFTPLQIHAECATWSEGHTYQAFTWLRGAEFITPAGRDDAHRSLYSVLDADRGKDLTRQLAEGSVMALKRPRKAVGHGVGLERALMVAAKIAELIEETHEPVSATQVRHALDGQVHEGTLRHTIRALQDIGYLSVAGRRRESGPTPARVFQIENEGALDRLKAEAHA